MQFFPKNPRKYSDFFVNSNQSRLPDLRRAIDQPCSSLTRSKSTKSAEKYESFKFNPYKVDELLLSEVSKRTDSTRSSAKKISSYHNRIQSGSKKKIKLKSKRIEGINQATPEQDSPMHKSELKAIYKTADLQGFCQMEALNPNAITQLLETSADRTSNSEKLKNISRIIDSNSSKLEAEPYLNSVKSDRMNENTLKSILGQYDLPEAGRDYELVDQVLSSLEFLSKFSKRTRINILKTAEIVHFWFGQTIFEQGDIGEYFFIVIKGSVIVEKNMKGQDAHKMIVTSIYDGKHFGDSTFISQTDQNSKYRQSTCIASEDSYCLKIDKNSYRSILIEDQKEEIEHKMKFLTRLRIFKSLESECLTNIATNLQILTFELGDVVLDKGQVPKGLYIVVSGNAKMCVQGYKLQGRISPFMNANKKSGFSYKHNEDQQSIIKRVIVNNIGPLNDEAMKRIEFFVPEFKSADKKNKGYITKDYLEFGILHSRDYFGGRVLLANDANDSKLASKFTIIVTSAKLTLFVLDKNILSCFSDKIVSKIFRELDKSFELDCPEDKDPDELDRYLSEWQNFKRDLTEKISREKYIERHKSNYPFVR